MDKAMKKRWVEALRSGKYKQGVGRLRQGNEFCCLGVLCDIVDPAGWKGDLYKSFKGIPPNSIIEKYELPSDFRVLVEKNDGLSGRLKTNFAGIADYIEANL